TLARNFFSRFCQDRKLNLEKIRSAILPQNLILPSHSKITLCGDAAGLIKPWSGGGVIWGLIGAKILLESFPDFLQYQKKLKSIFVPQIFLSKKAKKLVYFFGKKFPLLFPKQFKIDGDFLFPL
ncbi:hypothetical protein H5T58_02810, partial [Candidatus Parcubacteria bacterium]|nr:hypothetical protein [Candidatus Parcubacteria bacterium]